MATIINIDTQGKTSFESTNQAQWQTPEESGESNRVEEEDLRWSAPKRPKPKKLPRLTDQEFNRIVQSDPQLRKAVEKRETAIRLEEAANKRIKNTGYLSTLWWGVTGDSGTEDMRIANETRNASIEDFWNALNANTQFSDELKKQLRYHTSWAERAVMNESSKNLGDLTDRTEKYYAATKAVRNTAVAAWLGVSAVMTGGATLSAASTILAWEGWLALAAGTVAGWALTGELWATAYSLLRDEAGAVVEAWLDPTRSYGEVRNGKDAQILENATWASKDGMKFGVALPLAVTPVGQVALAGIGSYGWAKTVQNIGENFSQASQLSQQEKVARASWDTVQADYLAQQHAHYTTEWVLGLGDAAAILWVGRGIAKKSGGWSKSSPEAPPSSPWENVRRNPKQPVQWSDLPEPWAGWGKLQPQDNTISSSNTLWENIRRNPNKPVEWATLPDGRKIFKKVAPSDIRINYSSKNSRTTEDTSGNATKITRQYRTEYDRGIDENLGRTQIDSRVTHDARKKLLQRNVDTYWPGTYTNSPTQRSQAQREYSSNGERIGGTNRTDLSDWSSRVVRTTPDGIQATRISSRWEILKQKNYSKKLTLQTDNGVPETLPWSMKRVRERGIDSAGNPVGHNITYWPDGSIRRSVAQDEKGFRGVQVSADGNRLTQKHLDSAWRTTQRKEWDFWPDGAATIHAQYPQTWRETVSRIPWGAMTDKKSERIIYDTDRLVEPEMQRRIPTDEEINTIQPLPKKKKAFIASL